ncbi:MAG: VanZ family protein [Herbinix sp.]|nr:VanZ family protein [Herbinix sp.]
MKLNQVSWLPAVIIMIIIFCFSSKPADNSNESSMTVANEIITIYENVTNIQYQEAKRAEIAGSINHFVRKGAHFCEYALMAAAIAFHFYVRKRQGKFLFLMPIILSCLYAITDEFHQTFIPGRAGLVKDVLLDTSGAATGVFLFMVVIITLISKMKRRKHATL